MARIVCFDCYQVDLAGGQIYKRGSRLRLRDQAFRVLASLLEHPGTAVTRDELRRRLWPDEVFVDFDNILNTAVARLRQVLGDSADHPRFIETVSKRGYRFIAPVSETAWPAQSSPRRLKLLVLPFLNLSGDPAQEHATDAMTDALITELARVAPDELAVIARTTTMHYKGSRKDVARIGREVDVDYVVEGSARLRGSRVGVNVQLIQVIDQTHVFARVYEDDPDTIFSRQPDIASAIAAHIPGVRRKRPTRITTIAAATGQPRVHLAAYNEYIQGVHVWTRGTTESIVTATQHLERAIAIDPEFAAAYDALAELNWYLGYGGFVPPRVAFSRGLPYALRAIEIDNMRGETHALLGQFQKTIDYNWPEVEREMQLALRLAPTSPVVRMRYALSGLMPHGRLEEAVGELERALELDPMSLMTRFWFGIMLMLWRRYERALEECRKLIDLDSASFLGHFLMSGCYRYLGRNEEALEAQRKAVEVSGGSAMMLGWLGQSLAQAGQSEKAHEVLRRLHEMAAEGYVPPTSFAWIHLGLGEHDAAFQWLDRAVEECDQRMMPIKTYAFLDPIRDDPRFLALLKKMRLEH